MNRALTPMMRQYAITAVVAILLLRETPRLFAALAKIVLPFTRMTNLSFSGHSGVTGI